MEEKHSLAIRWFHWFNFPVLAIMIWHGAPLRLAIPVKYGVKNLKRIGTIRFTSRRPPNYWAERGYDWYAGL